MWKIDNSIRAMDGSAERQVRPASAEKIMRDCLKTMRHTLGTPRTQTKDPRRDSAETATVKKQKRL